MAVEVLHDCEPSYMPAEHCALCKAQTRYWYLPNDVALCQSCAEKTCDSAIPSKREWLEADGDITHDAEWIPDCDKRAGALKLPRGLVMSALPAETTSAKQMVLASIALHLLEERRAQSDVEVQLLKSQILHLSYLVEVYDARAEGKEAPKAQADYQAQAADHTAQAVLAADRVVKATPVHSTQAEAVDMIEEHHLRRFLSGEDSRAKLVAYPLKKKIKDLQKEIESHIQSGDLK